MNSYYTVIGITVLELWCKFIIKSIWLSFKKKLFFLFIRVPNIWLFVHKICIHMFIINQRQISAHYISQGLSFKFVKGLWTWCQLLTFTFKKNPLRNFRVSIWVYVQTNTKNITFLSIWNVLLLNHTYPKQLFKESLLNFSALYIVKQVGTYIFPMNKQGCWPILSPFTKRSEVIFKQILNG